MKKRICAALLTALVFVMGVCAYAADKVPFAVSRAASSVVRITVNNSFGTENVTGIVVGKGFKSRYILTSLRSVEGHSGDIFVGATGDQNIKAAGVIATSPATDLAVLELTEDITNVKIAKLKERDVKDGTEVYALGYYSRDDNNVINEGAVNSKNTFRLTDSRTFDVYQVTAQMNDRNNGGALVDKYGNVVGMNFYDGNVNQNKAITSGEIINVLDEKDVPYKKSTIIYAVLIVLVILAAIGAGVYMIISTLKNKKENVPSIIGIGGEFAGQRIAVGSESISIGRDAKSCQVVLMNDPKISRCHCSIRYDGMRGMFALTDLSSTHGTFLNNNDKLEPKVPVYIPDGTVFRVGDGDTAFRVSTGGGY